MPGKKVPENLKRKLPKHAEEIFASAYDSAYEQYKDPDKRRGDESREAAAMKVAWSAVKKEYKKGDDDKWHRK